MMSRVKKGLVAGAAAMVVVSVLEAVNLLAGPLFEPFPGIVAYMLGQPGNLIVGWIAHAVMGVLILGPAFGVLCPRLPTDTSGTKGIAFSVAAFVVMITGVFLIGDRGTFTGGDGFGTIGWMLITNVVFGLTMGVVYGQLVERERRAAKAAAMTGGLPA